MTSEEIKSRMSPPLPSLLGVIAGLFCYWLWPLQIGPYAYVLPIGILLVGLLIVLLVALTRAFKRHNTPADPSKETIAIINTGPFRFSRNPAYVSVAILQAAIGFFFNNAWIILFVIPAMIAIQHVVILREEAYLEAKFGDEYMKYKSQVRRWL